MKRFVKKLFLFALIFCVTLAALDVLTAVEPFRKWAANLTDSTDYYHNAGTQNEVRDVYIPAVRADGDYTKLVVGDSVCNQMLNDLQDLNADYRIAGNNRALTLAGEYLLIQEFLKLHEGITDVYLMIGLDMMRAEIDENYGYGYVVAPFVQEDMLGNLEEETIAAIRERFGTFFTLKPVVSLIERSAVNQKLYLSYLKDQMEDEADTEEIEISDVAALYLVKIHALCEDYGARLHLLADPLADTEKRHEQLHELRWDFERRGLEELFPDYFDEIRFYPEEQFVDSIHFGEPYNTREVLNQKIQELYLDRGYLEGLVLEV